MRVYRCVPDCPAMGDIRIRDQPARRALPEAGMSAFRKPLYEVPAAHLTVTTGRDRRAVAWHVLARSRKTAKGPQGLGLPLIQRRAD